MELGTAITGIVVVLVCAIPFIVWKRSKAKREKPIWDILSALAESNNARMTRYVIGNNSSIGLDETKHFLFFTRMTNGAQICQSIDLSLFQKCKVVKVDKNINTDNRVITIIEKIELILVPYEINKPAVVLEFYNSDYDRLSLTGEIQVAEEWCDLINDKIGALVS